jgi:hypothetical protein
MPRMARRLRGTGADARARMIAFLLGIVLLATTSYDFVNRLLFLVAFAVVIGFVVVWTVRNFPSRPRPERRGFEVQIPEDQSNDPK